MAWNPINDAEVQVNKPVVGPGGFGEKVKDNLNYLYGQIGSLGAVDVPNGSFEIDSDADGIPDGWTRFLYPGGSGAIETTSPAHGAKAVSLTHPGGAGNGGGYYESDYLPCSEQFGYVLSLVHWVVETVAGMKNQVIIRFFDKAKLDLAADEILYNSTSNSATATLLRLGFVPPTNARYCKIRLVGGYTDTDATGTAYWDGVTVNEVAPLTAGDNLFADYNSIVSNSNYSYTKILEAQLGPEMVGTIRVHFKLYTSNGVWAHAQIYVNGMAVGIERAANDSNPYEGDEDILVKPGDFVQIYSKATNTQPPLVTNVRFSSGNSTYAALIRKMI